LRSKSWLEVAFLVLAQKQTERRRERRRRILVEPGGPREFQLLNTALRPSVALSLCTHDPNHPKHVRV
jgi:hypothetical protein